MRSNLHVTGVFMSKQEQSAKPTRSQTVDELSEDTLGFGSADLRTARDLLVRPRQALETWMSLGPTGGGLYTRPLRLYLALNAILMLVLFLSGGSTYMLTGLPAEMLNSLIETSGKSRDAFLADADNWMTLIMVPFLATLYALVTAPLFRWWDAEDLGWRRGFRASFAYLNAWTLLILPISWFLYGQGLLALLASLAMLAAGVVTFLRMGRGRWYRSSGPGVAKALVILVCLSSVGTLGGMAISGIGLAAGLWF
jgi:hypothetical protein